MGSPRTKAVHPSPKARRAPGDRTSQEIVSSILDASALILERDGIDALTTNAIARLAGVSVGSLYRYFPNKPAIVAELARAVMARGRELVSGYTPTNLDDPRALTAELTRLAFHPSLGVLPLRRTLLREVPRSWIAQTTDAGDRAIHQILAGYTQTQAGQLRRLKPDEMAFVLLHASIGAFDGALLLEPSWLADPRFQHELFHLVWRFAAREGADLDMPDGEPATMIVKTADPSQRRGFGPVRKATAPRAQGTRRALLTAAATVLAKDGISALTVRRIASEANVTPGALYRHFSNIESIASELRFDYEIRVRHGVAQAVARMRGASLREGIAHIVAAYSSAETADLELRRTLLAEVPRVWAERATHETQRVGRLAIAAELERRGSEIREGDREMMAFIACRAVEGLTEAAIRHGLDESGRTELREHAIELVMRYVSVR